MLEWMHDESVVKDLQANFLEKTEDDCKQFILASQKEGGDYHLAIVGDNDEYQGTVSLRSIVDGTAEFAITIRSGAMGKGIGAEAMKAIIEMGFEQMGLLKIYWCVAPNNKRAVRFYDKNGYEKIPCDDPIVANGRYTDEQIRKYYWYAVKNEGTKI